MDDLDKMIRDAGIEQVPDNFTSGVMEEIRTMPLPQSSTHLNIPAWFKIGMTTVFAGALILAFFSMKSTPAAGNIWPEDIYRGIGFLSGLLEVFSSWVRAHMWMIPSVLFSFAGMFYLLIRDQDLYHHYS
jgi:hypothetical protein